MTEHIFNLKPTPKDNRDYSHRRTFGAPAVADLPDEFRVAEPIRIKNQFSTDFCSAFATTAVCEDEDRIEYSPEWLFQKEKELSGDWQSYGADIRTACKAATKGLLPQGCTDVTLDGHTRDFCANPANWPVILEMQATPHARSSYFKVDGYRDMFDNIRQTMWSQKDMKHSVLVGSIWYNEWYSPDGIIPKSYSQAFGGHAFKIFGWKQINGEPYLICQNSWGINYGDKGLFYFPRSVVNKEFSYGGAYCFVTTDQKIQTTSLILTIMSKIVALFQQLISSK